MPKHTGADTNPTLVVQRCCNDGLDMSLDLQSPKSTAGSKSLNPLNYNWHTGIENILLFYEKTGLSNTPSMSGTVCLLDSLSKIS